MRDASRWLVSLVVAHQFVTVFFVVAIEEAGIPLPAPSDLVIAYYGNRARGDWPELAQVVLVTALASTAGTLVPYAVARRWGRPAARTLARWLDVEPERVDRIEALIARRGFLAVFVGRLIPGLRVAMSLVAGTARVPPFAFSLAVFCAAAIYWSFWTAVGVVVGPAVEVLLEQAPLRYALLPLPLLFFAYPVYRRLRGRRRARKQELDT